jgi:hypothetical protein
LDIGDLLLRELVLVQRHFGDLEKPQEPKLRRQEEKETLARLACSGGSTDTVDVVSRVIRRVKLDDPVDLGNIETSRRDICAKQDTGRGVAELEKGVGSFLLLLLSLGWGSASAPNSDRWHRAPQSGRDGAV